MSTDGGKTWPIARNVIKGFFAYSALIQIAPDTVGLFYEAEHYKDINFVALPLADLRAPFPIPRLAAGRNCL